MCPLCIASVGAIIAAATSTGAVTTLAARKLRPKKNKKSKTQSNGELNESSQNRSA